MKKILIALIILSSCSKSEESSPESPSSSNQDFNIWSGSEITFKKDANTNPLDVNNQDSICPSVIITRGTSGGEIYNIILEESSTKGLSPKGTEWAIGDTSDIQNLTFNSFRNAVGSPKNVVGKKLVLHIIQANIYLPVEFISWGQGNSGSFSYKRTTQQ